MRRAREEGVSPEQFAADVVADVISDYDPEIGPPLAISDEELRASVEEQRRQIEAGTALLIPHEQVMAEMRAKLAKARDSKP